MKIIEFFRPRRNGGSTLHRKVVIREQLTEILLLIPAFGTMMLTYFGISVTMLETGATVVQKGQALTFAIAVGIFAWLGWFYLFGLIYRLTGMRLAATLLAGTISVGTLAAIDAPFNMLAIAGGSAVQMSLSDTTAVYEEKTSSASRATRNSTSSCATPSRLVARGSSASTSASRTRPRASSSRRSLPPRASSSASRTGDR